MNVLVIDDHPLFCEALTALLWSLDPQAQVVGVTTLKGALKLLDDAPALHLVLLDMNLPDTSHLAALAAIKTRLDDVPIAIISAEEDPALILKTIEEGASGYIPKSTDRAVMINALRIVLAHGVYLPPAALRHTAAVGSALRATWKGHQPELSERQRDVLKRLLQGKSNKVIARELVIAEGTVKAHLWSVYQALGVSTRVQAMCRVHELGMLDQFSRAP